ncbi:type II toxin-antitoxin system YafQ family toxin, partial [Acidithiobacillus caldus]
MTILWMNFHLGTLMPFGSSGDSLLLKCPAARPVGGGIHYISKKPAASKRANLPRASDYTKDFLKDWQRLSHSGRYDMNRLKEAMMLLIANNGPLPPEWL